MKPVITATPEHKSNIRWSPHQRDLKDFPENLQIRLRQIEPNRPVLTDQINGDKVFVRRVGFNCFQCGVFDVRDSGTSSKNGENPSLSARPPAVPRAS